MGSKRVAVERALYFMLFGLMGLSLLLFVFQNNYKHLWELYGRVYFILLLIYTWFIFILLFIGDMKKPKTYALPAQTNSAGKRIAVVMPCFNESAELLYRSVKSIFFAEGTKEILIVDDGSTDLKSKELLRQLAANTSIKIHFFDSNKGKRHALHYAVKRLTEHADYVVTVDSDTVLDKYALVRLIEPFEDPKVGATSGDVRLLNEKKNVLTRMVGAYYWIGLHIYKRAQSAIGIVVCCSGCLSAYRADLMKGLIDEFVNQKFFGEQCTHSEDRHLTNLVLKRGFHVKFVPEAISYTETPSTVKGFLKQQQRWKRGYIRESIYTLTYAWRVRPILFFEILLWELTIPFLSFGLMIALFVSIVTDPMFFLTTVLPAWIMFMIVRYIHIFFYAKRKIPGLLVYMVFYDLFLYWQSIYALFTVRNKSWITRG